MVNISDPLIPADFQCRPVKAQGKARLYCGGRRRPDISPLIYFQASSDYQQDEYPSLATLPSMDALDQDLFFLAWTGHLLPMYPIFSALGSSQFGSQFPVQSVGISSTAVGAPEGGLHSPSPSPSYSPFLSSKRVFTIALIYLPHPLIMKRVKAVIQILKGEAEGGSIK